MMKTEKDKVKKKVWEKPKMEVLYFKQTKSGENPAIEAFDGYYPS